jgi:hypothetical protein
MHWCTTAGGVSYCLRKLAVLYRPYCRHYYKTPIENDHPNFGPYLLE